MVLKKRMVLAMVLTVGLLATGCGGDDDDEPSAGGGGTQESGTIRVQAGVNDPQDRNIAVTEYLPESITVASGTTVEWDLPGPEPHSVTFFPAGQSPPPPGSDQSLFAPTPPVGPYDGKTLVNSGLLPLGPSPAAPFRVRFDTPGRYNYVCVIHPAMTGTINVAAQGASVENQAAITSRGDQERNRWLEEGRQAKKRLVDTPAQRTANPDATSTWTIEMGATTEHTDVLAFAPPTASIRPGDRVVFVNNSAAPHTATFPGRGAAPTDPESPDAQEPRRGPSPQTLNATDLFGTGLLPPNAPPGAGPPLQVRSFTFVVPAAGTYAYVCVFHAPSGMAGALTVA